MVSSPDQFPANNVFKYYWKGADDDEDATILYVDEKGGGDEKGGVECGDYESNDDGRGKNISHSGM
jgi:hypothetical protein